MAVENRVFAIFAFFATLRAFFYGLPAPVLPSHGLVGKPYQGESSVLGRTEDSVQDFKKVNQ